MTEASVVSAGSVGQASCGAEDERTAAMPSTLQEAHWVFAAQKTQASALSQYAVLAYVSAAHIRLPSEVYARSLSYLQRYDQPTRDDFLSDVRGVSLSLVLGLISGETFVLEGGIPFLKGCFTWHEVHTLMEPREVHELTLWAMRRSTLSRSIACFLASLHAAAQSSQDLNSAFKDLPKLLAILELVATSKALPPKTTQAVQNAAQMLHRIQAASSAASPEANRLHRTVRAAAAALTSDCGWAIELDGSTVLDTPSGLTLLEPPEEPCGDVDDTWYVGTPEQADVQGDEEAFTRRSPLQWLVERLSGSFRRDSADAAAKVKEGARQHQVDADCSTAAAAGNSDKLSDGNQKQTSGRRSSWLRKLVPSCFRGPRVAQCVQPSMQAVPA